MNRMMIRTAMLAAAGALAMTMPAAAAQVFSTGYDTPNGDGQASGGSYNYWDKAYTGAGATTTDGAALSGGKGDLTDGVVATDFWYNVETGAGTGPYVGWYHPVTPDPVVTFHFSGAPTIAGINIHIDNSYVGGVFAPGAILVDGVSQSFTGPAIGTIGWVSITGLSLIGNTHTLEFDQGPLHGWTFVSEITFDGKAGGGVPEPATWAMLITGFGMAGSALRRRRAAFV
jgi:hypothetical protein